MTQLTASALGQNTRRASCVLPDVSGKRQKSLILPDYGVCLLAHLTGTEGYIAARQARTGGSAMSNDAGLGALVAEIRAASENIASGDAATARRFEKLEAGINELYRTAHRPGGFAPDDFTR